MQGWLSARPVVPPKVMEVFAKQISNYTASRFNSSVTTYLAALTYSVALFDAILLYANAATKVQRSVAAMSSVAELHLRYYRRKGTCAMGQC